MAVTIKQVEAVPVSYPATPAGLSAAAALLAPAMIWQRIEAYIVHRWTARAVVWTVEGDGDWTPPLTPATVSLVEVWTGSAWVTATLQPSAFGGYVLTGEGPYRFTATVGGGAIPVGVVEAYARLAEYMADNAPPSMWKGRAGASSVEVDLGGVKQSFDRAPAWLARAMVNSGAGDLLRPYRESV